jgi:hypothetical protein
MLRERYCQLLTAYVDGVLSPRRQKMVQRLLEKSAQARAILQQLQENAQKVQNLPQYQLGPEFPVQVLGTIQTLKPVAKPVPASAGIPAWAGISAAAAVLLMVALGSYLFFQHENSPAPDTNIGPLVQKEKPQVQPKAVDPMIARILQGTADQFGKPVEIGTRITLADLGKEQPRASLDRELKKTPAVHLDLACKNGVQAVERLSAAFKKNGIQVLVDSKVRPKTGAGQALLVYAENIRPEELSTILKQLGQEDRQFDSVVVDALTDRDRHDVARLLGVEAKQLQPSQRGTDLPMLIEAPPKAKGKNSGADIPPPEPKRSALVLALGNSSNPMASPAIQEFLRSRRALRPGTLQVVVVLHPRA